MKTLKTFLTAAALLSFSAPAMADGHKADHEAAYKSKDIVDVAAGNENVSTLVAAVKAAELVDALKAEGPYTVFAPVNAAFDAPPAGALDDLLKPENKSQLQAVLTYHVIPTKVMSSDIPMGEMDVETLQGSTVAVKKTEDGVWVDGAKVIAADMKAKNGVIHAIDAVIMP